MIIFISPPFGNYFKYFKINSKQFDTEVEFIPIKGSFTLENRPGLISQIFKTLRYSTLHNGWINKIGLRNKKQTFDSMPARIFLKYSRGDT